MYVCSTFRFRQAEKPIQLPVQNRNQKAECKKKLGAYKLY